jgi:hypothetical protein
LSAERKDEQQRGVVHAGVVTNGSAERNSPVTRKAPFRSGKSITSWYIRTLGLERRRKQRLERENREFTEDISHRDSQRAEASARPFVAREVSEAVGRATRGMDRETAGLTSA